MLAYGQPEAQKIIFVPYTSHFCSDVFDAEFVEECVDKYFDYFYPTLSGVFFNKTNVKIGDEAAGYQFGRFGTNQFQYLYLLFFSLFLNLNFQLVFDIFRH